MCGYRVALCVLKTIACREVHTEVTSKHRPFRPVVRSVVVVRPLSRRCDGLRTMAKLLQQLKLWCFEAGLADQNERW